MWYNIPGTDKYMINKEGLLKNIKTGVIRAGSKTSQGYYELDIKDVRGKRSYRKLVHLIMAELFMTKPIGDFVVDHINNIKTDNSIDNLQYLSRQANASKGQEVRDASTTRKKVAQYSLHGDLIAEYNSVKEACVAIGVNSRSPLISYACKGSCSTNNCNTAYGYMWKFVE